MSIYKFYLVGLVLSIGLMSCNNDDDNNVSNVRDREEQQSIDDDSLVDYLKNYYYNSSDFLDLTSKKISDLHFTQLPEGASVPSGSTRLFDAVGTKEVTFANTNYKIYILNLNTGEGEKSPTFADDVRVIYEGFELDNTIFDSAVTPKDIDLLTTGIVAWSKVLPDFNEAKSFEFDTDGTINYINHGTGVMFIPSGLANFSGTIINGVPSFSPIIIKFELLKVSEVKDHDNDGIPSYLEDVYKEDGTAGSDGVFRVNFNDLNDPTDDDTDGDGIANYLDTDDDGDGVLTVNEDLEDMDLNLDSDGDGDPTNDKDGDGDPTNDDSDKDGIPNYLDSDDKESKNT